MRRGVDMWKDLGKKNVRLYEDSEELKRKREEEERKRREAAQKKSGMFSKLREKLSGPNLGELATQARKDVTKKGFWDK